MKLGIQSVGFITTKTSRSEFEVENVKRANTFQKELATQISVTGAKVIHFPRRNEHDSSKKRATHATLYAMQRDSETDS